MRSYFPSVWITGSVSFNTVQENLDKVRSDSHWQTSNLFYFQQDITFTTLKSRHVRTEARVSSWAWMRRRCFFISLVKKAQWHPASTEHRACSRSIWWACAHVNFVWASLQTDSSATHKLACSQIIKSDKQSQNVNYSFIYPFGSIRGRRSPALYISQI